MNALAGRRTRAYLLDCVGYLGIAACEVPVGIAVTKLGLADNRPLVYALSCVPPVLAAAIAARAESSPSRATWGKRRERLTVEDSRAGSHDQRIPFVRGLARNLVKITLPWQLGHTVAFGAARGGLRVADRVDPGDETVLDAHRQHRVELPVQPHDQSRPAVDVGQLGGEGTRGGGQADLEQPGDPVRAHHRPWQGLPDAASVAEHDDVGRQAVDETLEAVRVTTLTRKARGSRTVDWSTRFHFSQASCTTSSASAADPSIS